MIEEDLEFECPYCAVLNSVRHEPEGGSHQSFVVDCEICCQPIILNIHTSDDDCITLEASCENE